MEAGELTTIAQAFETAKAEEAPADAGGASPNPMAVGDADATIVAEQSTEPTLDGVKQELVNELLPAPAGEEGTAGPDPSAPEFWQTQVEVTTVNGTQQVPLGQLRDGFMRQADYTRKTQEVAALRNKLGTATEFYDQYNADPQAFARAIAVEQGLIYKGDSPVVDVAGVKLPTDAEINQRVEQMVTERVQADPAVQEALTVQAHQVVTQEFDRLEQVHQVKLPPEIRDSITKEAIDRGVPDFDLLLRARLASVQDQRRQAGQLQGAAPSRPGSSPGGQQTGTAPPEAPMTIEEAWKQSALEQSQLT